MPPEGDEGGCRQDMTLLCWLDSKMSRREEGKISSSTTKASQPASRDCVERVVSKLFVCCLARLSCHLSNLISAHFLPLSLSKIETFALVFAKPHSIQWKCLIDTQSKQKFGIDLFSSTGTARHPLARTLDDIETSKMLARLSPWSRAQRNSWNTLMHG